MKRHFLENKDIEAFRAYLCEEEKSGNTKDKYERDVRAFAAYCGGREIIKETVIACCIL